jgi:hypothetical protein
MAKIMIPSVEISGISISAYNNPADLIDFILEIDMWGVCDTGFTETLIKALVTSLKIDYTKDEMDVLLESLK